MRGKMLQVLGVCGKIILEWIWDTHIVSTMLEVVKTTLKFRGYMKDGRVPTDDATGSLFNCALSEFIRTSELSDST